MYIAFEIEDESRLRRVRWDFWYHDSRHKLVLNEYVVESRPSKRHGYKTGMAYIRTSARESSLREDQVPLTDEVKARALAEFTKELSVVLWSTLPKA